MAKRKGSSPIADVTSELTIFVGVLKGMQESAKSLSNVVDAMDIVKLSMVGVRKEARLLQSIFSTPLISKSFISNHMTTALDAFASRLADIGKSMRDMKMPSMGGRAAPGGAMPERLPQLKGVGRFKEMDTLTLRIANSMMTMNDEMGVMRRHLQSKKPWNRLGDMGKDMQVLVDKTQTMGDEMDAFGKKVRSAPTWIDKMTSGFSKLKGAIVGSIGFVILKDLANTQKEMTNMVARFSNWSSELGRGSVSASKASDMLTQSVVSLQGSLGAAGSDIYGIQKALIEGYIRPVDQAVESTGKLGATTQNFEDLTGSIYKMTQVTGASVETVGQYMKTLRMAGIRSKTTMKQIVTSFGGLEMSANDMDKMINSLDSFVKSVRRVAGLTGPSAIKITNAFKGMTASIVKNGATQEEAASLMGLFTDPLKNASALMQVFGVNAIEAGEALKTGDISGLIEKGFDSGQLTSFVEQMKNVPVAARGTMLAARGMSEEMYNAIVALQQGGKESLKTFADSSRSQKSLENDFATSRESFLKSWDRMANSFMSIMKTGLLPVLNGLSVVMGVLATGFDKLAGFIKTCDEYTDGWTSTVLASVVVIGGLLLSFNKLGGAFGWVGSKLMGLGKFLWGMLPNWKIFGKGAEAAAGSASSAITSIGGTLRSVGKAIMDVGTTIVQGLSSMIQGAAQMVGNVFVTMMQSLAKGLGAFANLQALGGGLVVIGLLSVGILAIGKAAEYAAPGLRVLAEVFGSMITSLSQLTLESAAGILALAAGIAVLAPAMAAMGPAFVIMAAGMAVALPVMVAMSALSGSGSGTGFLAPLINLGETLAAAKTPLENALSGMLVVTGVFTALGVAMVAMAAVTVEGAIGRIGNKIASFFGADLASSLDAFRLQLKQLVPSLNEIGSSLVNLKVGEVSADKMKAAVEMISSLSAFSGLSSALQKAGGSLTADLSTKMTALYDSITKMVPQMGQLMTNPVWKDVPNGLPEEQLKRLDAMSKSLAAVVGVTESILKTNDAIGSLNLGGGLISSDKMASLTTGIRDFIMESKILFNDSVGWATLTVGKSESAIEPLTKMKNVLEAVAGIAKPLLDASESVTGSMSKKGSITLLNAGMEGFLTGMTDLGVSLGKLSGLSIDSQSIVKPLEAYKTVLDSMSAMVDSVTALTQKLGQVGDLAKAGAKLAEIQQFMSLQAPAKVQENDTRKSLNPKANAPTQDSGEMAQTVEQTIAVELSSLRDMMGLLIASTDAFVPAIRENAMMISTSIGRRPVAEPGF